MGRRFAQIAASDWIGRTFYMGIKIESSESIKHIVSSICSRHKAIIASYLFGSLVKGDEGTFHLWMDANYRKDSQSLLL